MLEARVVSRGGEQIASTRFSDVVQRELPRAYRVAGYILADAVEAQDAVQDALERAWKGWPRLRSEDAASRWFWQIVVNSCRTRLRRRRAHPEHELDDAVEVEQEVDPFRASLARDAVGRALPLLTPDQRIVIVLRYWGELSIPEIADRLGIPQGTVKSRHHYAIEVLRQQLEQAEEATR